MSDEVIQWLRKPLHVLQLRSLSYNSWSENSPSLSSPCNVIPIAEPEFTKVRINENPLLKVPPARRGNRVGAPLAVPLAKRGEPKGGGQIINFARAIGIIPPPCYWRGTFRKD
jgi:hypothetical protein